MVIGALEYRDTSFKTEEDVMRVLSLPVLALVPVMGPNADSRHPRKNKKWRSALGTFGLLPGGRLCGRPGHLDSVGIEGRASHDVSSLLRAARVAVRAHAESQVPLHDPAAPGGAEQPAVRPLVCQGGHAVDWRGRDREDDAAEYGPRVRAMQARALRVSE